jgi:hypothetical protein
MSASKKYSPETAEAGVLYEFAVTVEQEIAKVIVHPHGVGSPVAAAMSRIGEYIENTVQDSEPRQFKFEAPTEVVHDASGAVNRDATPTLRYELAVTVWPVP